MGRGENTPPYFFLRQGIPRALPDDATPAKSIVFSSFHKKHAGNLAKIVTENMEKPMTFLCFCGIIIQNNLFYF